MSEDQSPVPAPHVVMVVGNDVRSDTRVKKSALSVARTGLRVTVVGYTRGRRREQAWMSGVRIVRVPVTWELRADPSTGLARVALGYRSDDAARRARLKLRVRRTDLDAWRARRVANGSSAVGTAVTTAGYRAGRLGLSTAARLVRWSRSLQRPLDVRRERRLLAGRGRARAWRRIVPVALDLELAMLDELVALRPDVIHAHDVSVVNVAAKAAALASTPTTRVRWVYDAHEYVAGISLYKSRTAVERAGWLALEAQHVPTADRMVTVSPGLADLLLERYRPEHRPAVVVNAPWPGERHADRRVGGVREAVELGPDVPLVVYSGGLTEARGVQTMVDALPLLPDVHLVVVPVPQRSPFVATLKARARQLGVADQLHFAPPVAPADVVDNLSTADVGIIPIMRFPSHDVALTNKLFEYLHAGLPVVVSDCPAQRDFVAEHQVGVSFATGDAGDLARAVREVFEGLESYRVRVKDPELLETWSWRHAERELVTVYRNLLGSAVREPEPVAAFPALDETACDGEADDERTSR